MLILFAAIGGGSMVLCCVDVPRFIVKRLLSLTWDYLRFAAVVLLICVCWVFAY